MSHKTTTAKSTTNWKRVRETQDSDIDLSDLPEVSADKFACAVVRRGLQPRPRKVQLTVRVDGDVVAWFRSRGRGYQTQINALLRAYMEAFEIDAHNKPKR